MARVANSPVGSGSGLSPEGGSSGSKNGGGPGGGGVFPNRGPSGKGTARYRALKEVCQVCPSKPKCCPNADARKITREEHEDARQVARDIAKTKQYEISMKLRKKVEMLFAHLKRILGLGRLRLRGPCGANDEFLLAATAQRVGAAGLSLSLYPTAISA